MRLMKKHPADTDSHLIYLGGTYLVLDFETTNKNFGDPLDPSNELLLACWKLLRPDGSFISKHHFGSEWDQQRLLQDIQGVDYIVAHNAKFELGWLARCGLDTQNLIVADTMLAEWVLSGNRSWLLNLETSLARRGLKGKEQNVAGLIDAGLCPSSLPSSLLLDYCKRDVDATSDLWLRSRLDLVDNSLLHIFYTRCLTARCLVSIEKNGMRLDKERVLAAHAQETATLLETQQKLAPGINFNSSKQLAEYLYKTLGFKELQVNGQPLRTTGGKPLTDSLTIASLVPRTPVQQEFLDIFKRHRLASSRLSKSLDGYKQIVSRPQEPVIYFSLNQGFTQTHRLSSSGRKVNAIEQSIQLQNQDRDFKKLFTVEDGYEISEVDYGTLEFTVAADMCRDSVAYEELLRDEDIHSITKQEMQSLGQKMDRTEAKAHTFKPLYGGFGTTKAEKGYCRFFKNKYEGISAAQESWARQVVSSKKLRTPMGMIFYWPDAKLGAYNSVTYSTQIYNYPIQSAATAEIVPIGLACLMRRLRGTGIEILNTVHDSIIAKIPIGKRDLWEKTCVQALTHDVFKYLKEIYDYDFICPLKIGIKTGTHWGEADVEKLWIVNPKDGSETYKEKRRLNEPS